MQIIQPLVVSNYYNWRVCAGAEERNRDRDRQAKCRMEELKEIVVLVATMYTKYVVCTCTCIWPCIWPAAIEKTNFCMYTIVILFLPVGNFQIMVVPK